MLRYASEVPGEQCVETTVGGMWMLRWSAGNWATNPNVCMCAEYTYVPFITYCDFYASVV